MNILHVTMTIERGGAENQIVEIIDYQSKNNIVSIIHFKGNDDWREYLEDRRVKIEKININILIIYNFIKIIKKLKPDVIHAHLQFPELISFVSVLFFPKIKFLVHKHNDENIRILPIILQRLLFYIISLRASKVVAISENVKKFCIKNHGINTQKINVIYYGIDKSKFTLTKNEYKTVDNFRNSYLKKYRYIIGTISRLHPQKSLDTLINSIFILKNEYNFNVVLLIVGEGNLRINLELLVSKLGIEENVIFLGRRNDIPFLYKCFDLFVLSSVYEGLGLVLLEAMASNTPVIATNVGAIPEILGENGIIIEPRNSELLAKTIFNYFNNIIVNNIQKNYDYNRIDNLFDRNLMLKKIDILYHDIQFK